MQTNIWHAETYESHSLAIERVIAVMRERLHEPLSLEDMADIVHLSPYHFNRVFHRLIGIPPGEFLTALRLNAAKRLLLTTSLSVTDVCFEVGYSSPGSFSTRFTQLVGLPPRHLRQLAENLELPSHESLPSFNTFSFCYIPFKGCFFGRISAPGNFVGLLTWVFFQNPFQGRPIQCTLLSAPGMYLIKSLPDGCYYVLAVALPLSEEPKAYLLPDAGLLVGMSEKPVQVCDGKVSGRPDIMLHPRD